VWLSRTPATIELTSPMPSGGRLDVSTLQLDHASAARAVLDGVASSRPSRTCSSTGR
jgi:hypothetical protein